MKSYFDNLDMFCCLLLHVVGCIFSNVKIYNWRQEISAKPKYSPSTVSSFHQSSFIICIALVIIFSLTRAGFGYIFSHWKTWVNLKPQFECIPIVLMIYISQVMFHFTKILSKIVFLTVITLFIFTCLNA